MIYSPMEQFLAIPIFQFNLTLTHVIFYTIIGALLIFNLNILNGTKIIPNYLGLLSDCFYRTLLNMVEKTSLGTLWLPLLYTLFFFVLLNNLIGLIPYNSTSSVELIITITISFTLLIGILISAIFIHKSYIFSFFLPSNTPLLLVPLLVLLEILAYLFRAISLALRLSINIMTGKILGKVVISFIYLGYKSNTSILFLLPLILLLTVFIALEILIAYLQAYILTFITILTLSDFQ